MNKTYNNLREGDYAKYKGDMTIRSGILRYPTIGFVEKFEMFDDKIRVLINPIDSEQSMWVDLGSLMEIETEWKHLEAIGFEKIEVRKDNYKYIKNGVTISGMTFSILKNGEQECYITRLCIGDFQDFEGQMIEPFIQDGCLNLSLFFEKYPSVYNLNRLVEELAILGIEADIKKLVKLGSWQQ